MPFVYGTSQTVVNGGRSIKPINQINSIHRRRNSASVLMTTILLWQREAITFLRNGGEIKRTRSRGRFVVSDGRRRRCFPWRCRRRAIQNLRVRRRLPRARFPVHRLDSDPEPVSAHHRAKSLRCQSRLSFSVHSLHCPNSPPMNNNFFPVGPHVSVQRAQVSELCSVVPGILFNSEPFM